MMSSYGYVMRFPDSSKPAPAVGRTSLQQSVPLLPCLPFSAAKMAAFKASIRMLGSLSCKCHLSHKGGWDGWHSRWHMARNIIYDTASNPNVVNASQGIWPAKAGNGTNTKGIVWVSASFRWALKFWCFQSNCTAHSHSFPTNLHPKIYKSAQQGEKNANICTMVKATMELWGWLVGISSTRRYCTSKIVVKPKKNLSQKLDQTKKRSVFRLTGSIWF